MAIVFTKDISTEKLLMAYNNNIVRFYSDTEVNAIRAEITGLGIDATLYPHPDGSFYFNFLDWITAEINTKNFSDDLQYELINEDADSFTYDVSNGCYKQGEVTFKIVFVDESFEEVTKELCFIAGAEQIEDFKKNEILFAENKIIVLSPVATRSNNTTYMKFWEGYPFEFSFYNKEFPVTPFTLKNNSTGLSFEFNSKGKVTSFFLSDGRTDITLEDFVPMVIGMNKLQFYIGEENQNVNLNIEKEDSECGTYIKFLNKYGRFNYWLFSKNSFRNRNSKQIGEINNDFNNIEDTTSPTLQIGKVSDENMKCAAEKLNQDQKIVLEQLIDSPKIYLFTGDRYSKSNLDDWMEIRLKTSSFETLAPKRNLYSYYVEFELPERYTIKL